MCALQDNKEIVMTAVSSVGGALEWTSARLQDNKDVVIAAVSSYGGALKDASDNLKDNEEVVNIALKTNPTYETLKHASKRLQHDTEFLFNLKVNVRLLANLKRLFTQDKCAYYRYFDENQHLEALLNS